MNVQLLISSMGAVHDPVRLLSHAQREEIRFTGDEVQVLIKNLTDVFGCLRSCYLVCEAF
jgi:hypothetical protein